MRDNIHRARLTRSRREHLLALVLLLSVVLVAGCTGGSGSPAAAKTRGSATPVLNAADDCLFPPATCYAPDQYRVAYGIQSLLSSGIDGRGETVTDLETAVTTTTPPGARPAPSVSGSVRVAGPPGQPPAITDIRQDLAKFDSMFRLPAARIEVVNSFARSPRPGWHGLAGR